MDSDAEKDRMDIDVFGKTDRGKVRSKNEDAFYIDPERGLFIVADGLGGHQGGEVASRLAVKEIVRYLTAHESDEMGHLLLREAVNAANEIVYLRSSEDLSLLGMGTTVVVAMIKNGTLWLAHVGDSRAYVLSGSGLIQMTEDHTVVYQMMKQGETYKGRHVQHVYRGPLSRAVGVVKRVEVDIHDVEFGGEALLLCTDGLTDMVMEEEIEEILRCHEDPRDACDSLISTANRKGGNDNITVVVVKKNETVQPFYTG